MEREKGRGWGFARAAAGLVCAGAMASGPAFGAARDIGEVADNLTAGILPWIDVLGAASYLGAVVFCFKGAMTLAAHGGDSRAFPLSRAIIQLGIAGLLFALPSTLDTAGETIFGEGTSISRPIDHGSGA